MTGGQMIKEPPRTGDEKLYAYMQEMVRQVNFALAQTEAATVRIVEKAVSSGMKEAEKSQLEKQMAEAVKLRSLIQQTATEIYEDMEKISTELHGSYVAISEWGTLMDTLESRITATAEGILQEYGYESTIQSLQEGAASFEVFKTESLQYIKTGLLYFEGTEPRYGVAVGETLTKVTVDGEEIFDRQNLCATFTSDKLAFWVGGVEVAYVSNNKLFIGDAEVTNRLNVGKWQFKRDANDGLVIRYTEQ